MQAQSTFPKITPFLLRIWTLRKSKRLKRGLLNGLGYALSCTWFPSHVSLHHVVTCAHNKLLSKVSCTS
ncbi:unnamed protein product [Heterobilharzia americana]|nr:unnamed protein product [Heterobilharzia americana]